MDINIPRDTFYQGTFYAKGDYTSALGNALTDPVANGLLAIGSAQRKVPLPSPLPVFSTTDAKNNPLLLINNSLQYRQEKRQKRASAWAKGPIIVAPLWTANEVITSNRTMRRLSNGQHIYCVTTGTCGANEPVVLGTSKITASVSSTNTLTVTAVTGDKIGIGTEITTNVTAGTKISAQVSGTIGGAGVYTITGNSIATVASTDMNAVSTPYGRTVTDGTVTWSPAIWRKSLSDDGAPAVTYEGAQAAFTAASGMIQNKLTADPNYTLGSTAINIAARVGIDGIMQYRFISADYRLNTTQTTFDSFAAAYGYNFSGMQKSVNQEIGAIITDVAFAIETNSANELFVEVDSQVLVGDTTKTDGGTARIIKYDFHGVLAERTVVIKYTRGNETVFAIHLTPLGSIKPIPKSTDTLLELGDSVWDSASPNSQDGTSNVGYILQKSLGFEGALTANFGGSGYIATAGNFTLGQAINDQYNQIFFKNAGVTHAVITMGLNDNANANASAVAAAALQAWKDLRTLLPNIKITIWDQWYLYSNGIAIAQALYNAFLAWGDPNARFCSFNGLTGRPALTQLQTSTSINSTSALTTGAKSLIVGTDNTHPPASSHIILGNYMANAIKDAWGDNY